LNGLIKFNVILVYTERVGICFTDRDILWGCWWWFRGP